MSLFKRRRREPEPQTPPESVPDEGEPSARERKRALLKAILADDAALDIEFEYEVAYRTVADRLDLVLAYDFVEVHEVPPREEVLQLGGEDELFDLALEQTRAGTADLELERRDFPNPDGSATSVWTLSSYSPFTATHGLWADTLAPPPSEHGTLVAMPGRHLVIAHPIRNLGVVSAVNHLLALSTQVAAADAGTISDGIYWLRDGELERLEHEVVDGQTRFIPSEGFLGVLNSLE
jgi:hypothetical protein